jgi:hypothetical protein
MTTSSSSSSARRCCGDPPAKTAIGRTAAVEPCVDVVEGAAVDVCAGGGFVEGSFVVTGDAIVVGVGVGAAVGGWVVRRCLAVMWTDVLKSWTKASLPTSQVTSVTSAALPAASERLETTSWPLFSSQEDASSLRRPRNLYIIPVYSTSLRR